MAYVTKQTFAATGAGNAVTSRGETNKGTFIVGSTVAGQAGTVTLEGAPDSGGPWYTVNILAGTTAAGVVTSTNVSVTIIDGNHAFLRPNCTVFTTGPIDVRIVIKDRGE